MHCCGGHPHLSARLSARERIHSRAVSVGVAILLLLTLIPLFAHHALQWAEASMAGRDHFGVLCVVALQLLLTPVHFLFHALLVFGLAYATWDRLRAWRMVRRVLSSLRIVTRTPIPGDPFWSAARAASVDVRAVRVVPRLPNPAFTVGAFRPKIYVARELADHLAPEELAGVLAHEGSHATRCDPLRFSLLRFLACTLFWVPGFRRLTEDLTEAAEVRADDSAVRERPLVLATAILRLAEWPVSTRLVNATVNFNGHNLLDRRIRRLTGEDLPVRSRVTRSSLLGAVMVLGTLWISSTVMAHPLPLQEHHPSMHCDLHAGAALTHLLCAKVFNAASLQECLHTDSGVILASAGDR